MTKFTALDEQLHAYVVDLGAREDEVLRRVREETAAMGDVAGMQISPDEGAFLSMLCRVLGVREAVEVGTFTGYSAICLARGLADGGRLVACELSEEYAEIASRNLAAAGVADRVEIRIGPAADTLRAIPEREVLDLAFIDADKTGYAEYYELLLARMRPGGVIAVDNVLAGGDVVRDEPIDFSPESVAAIRALNTAIAGDERVDCVMLPMADGLTLVRKRPDRGGPQGEAEAGRR
jgi:caffeoyl-CoA O-methyltransferase